MFSAATQQAVTANSGTFAMYRQAALKPPCFCMLCKLFLHSCLWLIKLITIIYGFSPSSFSIAKVYESAVSQLLYTKISGDLYTYFKQLSHG